MIVDSLTFAHDGLLAALDRSAIDRAIVCPPRARGHGYDVENDRVAALVAAHPDRLVGFARVDPLAPGASASCVTGKAYSPATSCRSVTRLAPVRASRSARIASISSGIRP